MNLNQLFNFWIETNKSGAASGVGVDLALFPLDTVKTRLQSKQGFWKSGGFRGIYNGLPSTLVGSAPAAALFFTVYDTTKRKLESSSSNLNLTTLNQIVAANLGEMSACLIRVPVDVVKQRAQASQSHSAFSILKQILVNDVRKIMFNIQVYMPITVILIWFKRALEVCIDLIWPRWCERYRSARFSFRFGSIWRV